MVDVAVVGVGKVGATLASAWYRSGLDVALAGNDLESSTIIALAASFGLRRLTIPDAIRTARVIVVADPVDTVEALFAGLGPDQVRAVVIDASPGDPSRPSHLEALRRLTPGAAVYRAFNTLVWSDFIDPDYDGIVPDLFYAGPDDDTRDPVEGLVGAIGLRPIYVGGYEEIELVDALAALRSAVAARRPDRDVAVKLLERRL